MARANWKGHLRIDLLTCPVALYSAVSSSDRVSLVTLDRETGNRVRREWFDEETEAVVDAKEAVRGYEIAPGEHVVLDKEEVDATVPASDKTITVERFVAADDFDSVFYDRPYFLGPADRSAAEAFAVVRDALAETGSIALGRTVLFRRPRWLAVTARGAGLVAHTLHADDEVRPASKVFADIADVDITDEMLDLARHIIDTKTGRFEPKEMEDRYEKALVELIRAKQAGRKPKLPARREPESTTDLLEALRRSAGIGGAGGPQGGGRGGDKRAAASRPAARRGTRERRKKAG